MEDFLTPLLLLMGGGRKGARLFSNLFSEMTRHADSESGESVDEDEMQAFAEFTAQHMQQTQESWICDLCNTCKKTEKAMKAHFEEEHFDDFSDGIK